MILMLVSILTLTIISSCSEEETPAKPVVTILELGQGDSHGNDHTATVGGDLHIEAEIDVQGREMFASFRQGILQDLDP